MSDAKLIKSVEKYLAGMDALDAGGTDESYCKAWQTIFKTQPVTIAGVAAKAKLAIRVEADNLTEEVCRNLIALAG